MIRSICISASDGCWLSSRENSPSLTSWDYGRYDWTDQSNICNFCSYVELITKEFIIKYPTTVCSKLFSLFTIWRWLASSSFELLGYLDGKAVSKLPPTAVSCHSGFGQVNDDREPLWIQRYPQGAFHRQCCIYFDLLRGPN